MENTKKKYVYTTKRSYLVFILLPLMLMTGFIVGKHYLYALLVIPVWLIMMRFVKYADFRDEIIEVCYPLRKNNLVLEYSNVTSIQFYPKPLKGDAAIIIYTKSHGDYNFAIYPEQGNPIIQRVKQKNPNVIILKPEKTKG